MALDKARLKTAIHDRVIAELGMAAADDALLLKVCKAFADAIIDEITANAVVQNVAPGSFTNAGGAVTGTGGPGTII